MVVILWEFESPRPHKGRSARPQGLRGIPTYGQPDEAKVALSSLLEEQSEPRSWGRGFERCWWTGASCSPNSMYERNVMTPARGFFSLIQFCPDLDRGEYANVGIVLVVPQRGILDIRLSEDNKGPKQRFGSTHSMTPG